MCQMCLSLTTFSASSVDALKRPRATRSHFLLHTPDRDTSQRFMPSSYIRLFSLVINSLGVPCAIVNARLAISPGQPRTVLWWKIWLLTTGLPWVFSDIKAH